MSELRGSRPTCVIVDEWARLQAGEGARSKPATELLPPDVLAAVAQLLADSAAKHAGRDFSAGRVWSEDYAALMRHLLAFWAGQDRDPHSGEPHAIHIAARGLLLAAAVLRWPGLDDRPAIAPPDPAARPRAPP